jgi:hypothetical protein
MGKGEKVRGGKRVRVKDGGKVNGGGKGVRVQDGIMGKGGKRGTMPPSSSKHAFISLGYTWS